MPTLRLAFVHNRRGHKDKNRTYPVELRITCNGSSYVQAPVRVRPDHWSDKRRRVVKHNLAPLLNLELQKLEEAATRAHLELGPKATAKAIRLALTSDPVENTVLAKFREYYRRRADHLAEGTLKQDRTLFSYLERYDPDLSFSDLRYRWVTAFEQWLLNQPNTRRAGTLSRNYVSSLLAILRTYCSEAVKEEYLPNNPVKLLRLEKERKQPVYLTHAELMDFAAVETVGRIQQQSQDMFLFAASTSLRVSDLFDLRKTEIHPTTDGYSLHRIPQKTGLKSAGRYHIPIDHVFDGLPGRIYRKYAETTGPHLFPRMDVKSYRDHIKIIARAAGLKQKITTHVARHTFAMVCLNYYDWRLEEVSRAMGHTNVNTTQKYTRVLYRKIVQIAKRKAQ